MMEIDTPAVNADTENATGESAAASEMDLLPEAPATNTDEPPETDQTLEDILDAANAEPIATVNPTESIATVDPIEPIATVDPTQPIATVDTTEPIATVDPTEPIATVDPTEPIATVDPTEPIASVDPTPAETANDTDAGVLTTEAEAQLPASGETTENMIVDAAEGNAVDMENKTDDHPQDAAVPPAEVSAPEKQPDLPKQPGSFNLGVPGLKFSSDNVKTAKDGTKMVQIHQSQITPEQLVALQNNPNIKVVFRHVPSGKSYSKAPRHLLPPGYSSPIKKRKANFTEEELQGNDVYSFDEGEDLQGPAKKTKFDSRFKFNYASMKKKGKQRAFPDSGPYASSYLATGRQSGLPAKVILTDLLARINNPNAKKEIKVHTSQINAEVLANMELNPMYKIILTTKQELPPLVIENVDAEEQAKLEKDAAEIENREKEDKKEEVEKTDNDKTEKEPEVLQEDEQKDEEQTRVDKEKEEQQRKEKEAEVAKKVAQEEEELKKSVMQSQRSRSGRIRKPSKYALDIARLTKRKSTGTGGGESSEDESGQDKTKSKKPDNEQVIASPARGKGRPRKVVSPLSTKKTEKNAKKVDEKSQEKEVEKRVENEKVDKTNEQEEKEVTSDKNETDNKTESADQQNDGTKSNDKVEGETENTDKKQEVTESDKEVTSTDNVNEEDKKETAPAEASKPEQKTDVDVEPVSSTDATAESEESKKAETMEVDDPLTPKEPEEDEVIDNKYRLRKLLEQCSTEEIRSVLLPEAFDSINLGDFLLYKSGQMHNTSGMISFPKLYKEFERLHKDATKEATRYNILVRRANKVGGDKRMEKIVLMPVYNIEAANSLQISNSSIDAHICGIQRTITTEMIAANSFFIKSKMESPAVRLKLPEATAAKSVKPKLTKPLYTNQHQQMFTSNRQQEPDSTTPDKPKPQKRPTYGQKIASMKYNSIQNKSRFEGMQVRRPAYIEQLKNTGQITLAGQNHQIATKPQETVQTIPVDSTSLLRVDVQSSQVAASATSALAQLQATVEQQQQAVVSTTQSVSETMALNPVTGELMPSVDTAISQDEANVTGQTEQYFVTEDGVPVATSAEGGEGEVRKHLVPIGDGQYVELPEGYSLIQTDEGYIIGQPGSTFTQGEDGNVYITNSDGTTTEITREDIAGAGAGDDGNAVAQETEG